MNFNPMDLIKIKEFLYDPNSIPYKNITNFIDSLVELQLNLGTGRITEEEQQVMGFNFFIKQEMIENAFQIAKLSFEGL